VQKLKKSRKLGTQLSISEPKLVQVVFLNDDFTPMTFVVDVLVRIYKKGYAEAVALMLEVHNNGSAVVGEYPLEIALTKVHKTLSEARSKNYPLQVVIKE
jgi:ATP-dependent Clp protease adaptor protein ClpS